MRQQADGVLYDEKIIGQYYSCYDCSFQFREHTTQQIGVAKITISCQKIELELLFEGSVQEYHDFLAKVEELLKTDYQEQSEI